MSGGGGVRLVATDLDGTLLRRDGTVSDRTRAALRAAEDAGLMVVFVTGRPPRWLPPVAEQTGHTGLAICANGAVRYDLHSERVVAQDAFAPQAARALVEALREGIPGVAFAVERGEAGFAREEGYHMLFEQPGVVVEPLADLVAAPMVKVLVRHRELDPDTLLARAREVVAATGEELGELTHSSREGLLEISAAGVSKATGLARLAAEHGIGPAAVVAFGDMPNDVPLLAWAGRSVAVANAHPDVLAVAGERTASNEDDGVARVVERVLREMRESGATSG